MIIVYCTTNKVNGKKYIGSHNGNKPSYLGSGVNLTQAIKKYGKENFIRQTLWEGPSEFRYEMEEYWIAYFDAAKNQMFYNATEKGVGAGWSKGKKRGQSSLKGKKRKIDYSKRKTDYDAIFQKIKKPILQYNLDGSFVKEWPSAKDVKKSLNINNTTVNLCCNNKMKSAGGFMWLFKTDQYLLNIPPFNNKKNYPKNRKSKNTL